MYTGGFLENGQIEDLLTNRLSTVAPYIHPIDLAFWNLGIHDWGWWVDEPVGVKFYEQMVHSITLTRQNCTGLRSVCVFIGGEVA